MEIAVEIKNNHHFSSILGVGGDFRTNHPNDNKFLSMLSSDVLLNRNHFCLNNVSFKVRGKIGKSKVLCSC